MCSRSLACSEPSSLGPSSMPCSVAVRRDLGRILRVIPGKGSLGCSCRVGKGVLCSHLCSLSSFCAGSASPSPFPARILAVSGGGRGLVQGGSGLHPWVHLLHTGCWCWARCLVSCPAGWEQGPWGWSLVFVGAGGEHPKYTARDGTSHPSPPSDETTSGFMATAWDPQCAQQSCCQGSELGARGSRPPSPLQPLQIG